MGLCYIILYIILYYTILNYTVFIFIFDIFDIPIRLSEGLKPLDTQKAPDSHSQKNFNDENLCLLQVLLMEVDIEASLEELKHAIQQRLGIMIEQQRLIVLGVHKILMASLRPAPLPVRQQIPVEFLYPLCLTPQDRILLQQLLSCTCSGAHFEPCIWNAAENLRHGVIKP